MPCGKWILSLCVCVWVCVGLVFCYICESFKGCLSCFLILAFQICLILFLKNVSFFFFRSVNKSLEIYFQDGLMIWDDLENTSWVVCILARTLPLFCWTQGSIKYQSWKVPERLPPQGFLTLANLVPFWKMFKNVKCNLKCKANKKDTASLKPKQSNEI